MVNQRAPYGYLSPIQLARFHGVRSPYKECLNHACTLQCGEWFHQRITDFAIGEIWMEPAFKGSAGLALLAGFADDATLLVLSVTELTICLRTR